MKLVYNGLFKKYLLLSFVTIIPLIFLISIYDIIKIESNLNLIFNKIKILSGFDSILDGEIQNVFIDLGANKGDSIYNFVGLNNQAQGGNLNNNQLFPQTFKTAKWIIYGFEANSFFDEQLIKMKQDVEEKLNHTIYLYKSTAAWIYDGTIDFYLDTVNAGQDFWGSSLNQNHVIYLLFFH